MSKITTKAFGSKVLMYKLSHASGRAAIPFGACVPSAICKGIYSRKHNAKKTMALYGLCLVRRRIPFEKEKQNKFNSSLIPACRLPGRQGCIRGNKFPQFQRDDRVNNENDYDNDYDNDNDPGKESGFESCNLSHSAKLSEELLRNPAINLPCRIWYILPDHSITITTTIMTTTTIRARSPDSRVAIYHTQRNSAKNFCGTLR
ncbi:MAG: hypothetical protein JXA03_09690 [Bacteroidales bacterium]|nr:hypothetical protein [Bacteroidales bacterium]